MNRSKATSSAVYGYTSSTPSLYSPNGTPGPKTTKDIGVGYGNVEFEKAPRKACGIVRNNGNSTCGI